jgi:hypothetical protein
MGSGAIYILIYRIQHSDGYILQSFDTREEAEQVFALAVQTYGDKISIVEYEPGLSSTNFGQPLIREDIERKKQR